MSCGSSGISKKSLYLNRIDVGRANNAASEAFQFASPANCAFSSPDEYNFEQYGRNANVFSLNFGGNGQYADPCTNLNPQQNLQSRIATENEVERQFIDFTMAPGLQYPYGTMGVGRTMIEQRSGGTPGCMYGAVGGWGQQYDMPTDSMPGGKCAASYEAPPPQFMESQAIPPKNRLQLHYMFANKFNG